MSQTPPSLPLGHDTGKSMSDYNVQTGPADRIDRGTNGPLLAFGALAALALIAAITFAVLWAGARSELAAATDQVEQLRAAEVTREQEAAARPDVGEATRRWLGDTDATITGDEQSATVRIRRVDPDTSDGLDGLLDELGFSTAVRERMARTRALDGTQDARGHNVNVTWTYHPDSGLQMVFEGDR
jgi:hypothetical protein